MPMCVPFQHERESLEREVQVLDCSKAGFKHVLEYLCYFTIGIDHVVELWQLADMYLLGGLKYVCIGSLERGLHMGNVTTLLEDLDTLSCPFEELKKCATHNIE